MELALTVFLVAVFFASFILVDFVRRPRAVPAIEAVPAQATPALQPVIVNTPSLAQQQSTERRTGVEDRRRDPARRAGDRRQRRVA